MVKGEQQNKKRKFEDMDSKKEDKQEILYQRSQELQDLNAKFTGKNENDDDKKLNEIFEADFENIKKEGYSVITCGNESCDYAWFSEKRDILIMFNCENCKTIVPFHVKCLEEFNCSGCKRQLCYGCFDDYVDKKLCNKCVFEKEEK